LTQLQQSLRSFDDALRYPPNQVFIGNMTPESLRQIERPWIHKPMATADNRGPFGCILDQAGLYGLMKLSDDFDLLLINEATAEAARKTLVDQPLPEDRLERIEGISDGELGAILEKESGLPLYFRGEVVGFIRQAHPRDDTLKASVLLENLVCKATAVLALGHAVAHGSIEVRDIDYLLNSGEEAVGDRYQRGAGSLSKAIGEVVGCEAATGVDIKAFCASPVHSLIMAASLVEAGVFQHVAVIGGGSQAKLGMKFKGHLGAGVPIMEDVLGSMAFVIGPSNGVDPEIRLDSVGMHSIGAGSSARALYEALVVLPLEKLGWNLMDMDRYAVELHNPEITEPAGGGDVPQTNYRTLAALAVMRGEIHRDELEHFVETKGMPGFAPTQGHIPAGVPYLGHARRAMANSDLDRIMVVAKGSLFLGRMTQLVDGVSFVMQRPNGVGG
jgi:betaine reductase